MAKRIITIYYDITSNLLRSSTGTPLRPDQYPYISNQEAPIVNLQIVTDDSNTAYTGLDATWVYRASVDKQFRTPVLMCQSLHAAFNRAGDWDNTGNADLSTGQLAVRLDANTDGYKLKIGNSAELPGTLLEIVAVDSTQTEVTFAIRMPLRTKNSVVALDLTAVQSEDLSANIVKYTDPTTGEQFIKIVNDDGIVLEVLKPVGA